MAEKRRPRWSGPTAGSDRLSWYLLRRADSVGVEKVPIAHCWPLASDLSMLPSESFSRGSTSKNVCGAASSTTFFGANSLKPNSSENHRLLVAPAYIAQQPLRWLDGTRSAGRSARLVMVGASANAIHTRAAPMESRSCVGTEAGRRKTARRRPFRQRTQKRTHSEAPCWRQKIR